jgi:hypothetical protein
MENKRKTWSGSPCPLDPDNYWTDDETGERVNAVTGERRPYTAAELEQIKRKEGRLRRCRRNQRTRRHG